MLIKIHSASRHVVALCDKELIDQKFEDSDGVRQLDLTTTFFKGEEKSEKEIEEMLHNMRLEDSTFNIVGKNSCELAKRLGLIKEDSIQRIANIPVVLILA